MLLIFRVSSYTLLSLFSYIETTKLHLVGVRMSSISARLKRSDRLSVRWVIVKVLWVRVFQIEAFLGEVFFSDEDRVRRKF